MLIDGQPVEVVISEYEGVTSEDFAAFSQQVDSRLAALDAMSLVLIVAVFFCAGILAVDTLVRSMEKF